MNKPELLSPAGDLERLKIAILYGADAVYVGGPLFSLRANATNFTLKELKEGVIFAHQHNCKVYVTVNIVLHNKESIKILDYLKKLDKIGVDAIIASDPYIVFLALHNTKLKVHLSTQQSTLNYEAIDYWKKKGVSRIVLGREISKKEIDEIRKKVDIELECFIHGAMCAGYSGRCVLSNYFTNRDANRGGCAQICRWDFSLLDENKQNPSKDFTFCTKDLSMLENIKDMIDQGITSFKIEGRMRSTYYIATSISIYRKVIDEYWHNKDNYKYNKEYEKILRRVANRDSVPQFYDGKNGINANYYNGRMEISNQDFLGIVKSYKDGYATIEQRNYFKVGDEVEFFGPNIDVTRIKLEEILDEDNNSIDIVCHPKQIVKIKIDKPLYKDDMMRVSLVDK